MIKRLQINIDVTEEEKKRFKRRRNSMGLEVLQSI